KRSILLDSKADLVVYGMGETSIVEIAKKFAAGGTLKDLRSMRGIAYALGAKESGELFGRAAAGIAAGGGNSTTAGEPPAVSGKQAVLHGEETQSAAIPAAAQLNGFGLQLIPSFEQVRDDKLAFAEATRIIHTNTNPFNAATLVQFHDRQAV